MSGGSPPPEHEFTTFSADAKTLITQLPQLFVGNDGALRRKWEHRGQPFHQIVIPASHRRDIADQLHRGLNGGHLGLRRAELQLQKRWTGWRQEVRQAQYRCQACARYKRPHNLRQGHLQPMVVGVYNVFTRPIILHVYCAFRVQCIKRTFDHNESATVCGSA